MVTTSFALDHKSKMSDGSQQDTVCGSKTRKIFRDFLWLSHATYQKNFFMSKCFKVLVTRGWKKNLVQPQSGLSRGHQAKPVRNAFCWHQNAKKRPIFVAFSLQHFYPSITNFMTSKNSFKPNLLDLERKFDFGISMTPLWPLTIVHPKSTKMAKLAF